MGALGDAMVPHSQLHGGGLGIRTRNRLIPALILSGLCLASIGSQASPGEPRGGSQPSLPAGPIEHAVSELVLIETYVTDSSGRALTGLTIDDFVLIVDGRKSPIASFELREIEAPPPGAATPTDTPLGAKADELPRRFALFFEDGTSAPTGLVAARRAAHELLSKGLLPSDQVAIAACDTGLRIVRDFTTDREVLRKTIDEELHEVRRVSDFAAEQQRHEQEIGDLLNRAKAVNEIPGLDKQPHGQKNLPAMTQGGKLGPEAHELVKEAKSLAVTYGWDEAAPLRNVLRSLKTLVDSIAGWPGYKAIVYMGDGLPENPALPYVEAILDLEYDPTLMSRISQLSLASDLQILAEAAAASGVTIHTLQTRGLEAGDFRQLRAAQRRSNSLSVIALNTGGLASSSNDFLKALNEFETSSRSYYILGYRPEGPADGRFHSVQVKCKKGDARVRWRRGFTRLKPEQARERALLAAYTVPEMFPGMRLGLSAVEGPASVSGRIADLVVHIPGDAILFLREDGVPTAHLEVGLVAVDDKSKDTVQASRKLTLKLRPEQGKPGEVGIDLVHRVHLPPGAQTVTAVVQDKAGDAIGGARLSLRAASTESDRVLGLSIYSLRDESLWIDLPDGEGPATPPSQPLVDTTDRPQGEYPIGPSLKAAYAQGEPLVCGFRLKAVPDGEPARLRIAIRQGDTIVRTAAIRPPAKGADERMHVPVPVEELPPGEYVVAIQELLPSGPVDMGETPLVLRPAESVAAAPAGSR